MSPQLRQILVHAKQLNHTEQLMLITHMVNHALPLDAEPPLPFAPELPLTAADRSTTNAPEPSPEMLAQMREDPQYAEFRDEITLYKQNLGPQLAPQLGLD
jgi:hypothetical protein